MQIWLSEVSEVPLEERQEKKLGWEFLQQRLSYRKLCFFFKICKNQCLKYLSDVILQSNSQYKTRDAHIIPQINVKYQFFKNS